MKYNRILRIYVCPEVLAQSSPLKEMKYLILSILVSRQRAGLNFDTQNAILPDFCRKYGTEYLNTMFPMSTLLCAESSVKLKRKCMCQCTNIERKTSTLN